MTFSDNIDPQERLALLTRSFKDWGGVNPTVEVSATFAVRDAEDLPKLFTGELGPEQGCYLYGRCNNPTARHLGRQLAALEGTEAAYPCASGLAAITCALMNRVRAGDHIIAPKTVYGGTFKLLTLILRDRCGVDITFVDSISQLDDIAAAITPKSKVLYCETLSNPSLVVADLPALAELAHSRGLSLVVDNTFIPVAVCPARWGADVVVHSVTKFIGGGADIVAGVVCGSKSFIDSLTHVSAGVMTLLGPTMDPKIASELGLRVPLVPLRMAEHSRRALHFAQELKKLGYTVIYPGLPDHPQHKLFDKIATPGYGYGGMLALDMGSLKRANQLLELLQNKFGFGLIAVSLGYFDTLMSVSGATTSAEMTANDKEATGITEGLIRLSIGLTGSLEQRWEQMKQALEMVDCNNFHSESVENSDEESGTCNGV